MCIPSYGSWGGFSSSASTSEERTMILAGKRLVIISPKEPPLEGRIPLIIQRGAFGSGEHETTLSCLEELENLAPLDGARVLDLGCGTGILAIAAALLGANPVTAVDIDPKAVEVTQENTRLNGIKMDIRLGSIEAAPGPFHLIMANIHGDILMALAPQMVGKLLPGGTLLLSGVAFHENYQVLLTFQSLGCQLLKNRFMEEYTTLLLERS